MYEIGKPEIDAVKAVIESGQMFRYRGGEGGECEKFEREFSEALGCKYALTVNQGTAALICGLIALEIGPGDEVIVPAYTFMASPLAVVAVGAVPVIAEVDESLTLDPLDTAKKITRRTKAIMPVHMTGLPCNMNALKKIAKERGIRIIEDVCQAVGGSYRGRRLGSIGEVGAFSFNQFKNISCGEGGAVVTSNKQYYHRALITSDGGCAFRGHDMSEDIFCGVAFRVSEIQGAILRRQLKRMDGILKKLRARKKAACDELQGSKAYRMNPVNCRSGDCGAYTGILFESPKERARAQKTLADAGLGLSTPLDSGIHVYSNWEPILKQKGANHRKRNAFKIAGKTYRYTKTMCPESTRILGSTLFLWTDYNGTLTRNRQIAKQVRKVIEGS